MGNTIGPNSNRKNTRNELFKRRIFFHFHVASFHFANGKENKNTFKYLWHIVMFVFVGKAFVPKTNRLCIWVGLGDCEYFVSMISRMVIYLWCVWFYLFG